MAPMYILARDIDDRKTTAAMRLRLIRTYDIVQRRYSDKVRSRECVFHDEEVTVLLFLKLPSLTGHSTEMYCMGSACGKGTRCNKKVDLKGGMYVCGKCGTHCDKAKLRYKIKLRVYDAKGSAPSLLWDREALELLGGITAEELKAMQPKVPTKIPKEIVSLVGRGMLFKINVERDRLEKRNLAFPVMQIKDDIAVVNEYCPGLLKVTKQKPTNSVEQLDDDLDSDAGFFSDEEAESPLPNSLT
nr:uncharacterized protein LOC109189731 [Ipomoea trifida]